MSVPIFSSYFNVRQTGSTAEAITLDLLTIPIQDALN